MYGTIRMIFFLPRKFSPAFSFPRTGSVRTNVEMEAAAAKPSFLRGRKKAMSEEEEGSWAGGCHP